MYVSLFAGVLSLPVLESLLAAVAGIHALLAGGPLARADFAILFNMLESLNEAEDLINVTTDGEVVELAVNNKMCLRTPLPSMMKVARRWRASSAVRQP